MTLRTKLVAWLIALHVLLAAVAVVVLLERPRLLFALEALFVLSIVLSVRLVRSLFVPLDLIRTGSELIAERDFTSRFVPTGQPEMDSLIAVYNGMIDRLREERVAAEEQQQLLARIVEASPSGIVIRGFDGEVEQTNPAARRLLTPELEQQLAGIAPGESRLVGHGGSRRLKVSCAEFRDRGFPKRFQLIEEMTGELRSTEKAAYEKLIRMMSHEVNNSVGAVRSLLESTLRYAPQVGESDRGDFVSALTIASSRVDALNRFMSAFADVVRIPAPQCAPASVAAIVERVGALLRPELESRAIRLELSLDDQRSFPVDAAQIEQVVLNLFRNAIEAVGREGTLRASLSNGVLTVADSGPGIPAALQHELFTPFFTTKRDGRGLGLTVAQEILVNHGFEFSLRNRPEGGAEFAVRFGE